MHKSMVKRFNCFLDQISEWGRNVIWVTLTVEWLLVPDKVVWISQKLLISWDFHTQQGVLNKKQKTSCEQQFCGQKCLVNERGRRRRARLVKADRKVIEKQITTHYNSGMQKSISEHRTRRTSKWIQQQKSKGWFLSSGARQRWRERRGGREGGREGCLGSGGSDIKSTFASLFLHFSFFPSHSSSVALSS